MIVSIVNRIFKIWKKPLVAKNKMADNNKQKQLFTGTYGNLL